MENTPYENYQKDTREMWDAHDIYQSKKQDIDADLQKAKNSADIRVNPKIYDEASAEYQEWALEEIDEAVRQKNFFWAHKMTQDLGEHFLALKKNHERAEDPEVTAEVSKWEAILKGDELKSGSLKFNEEPKKNNGPTKYFVDNRGLVISEKDAEEWSQNRDWRAEQWDK